MDTTIDFFISYTKNDQRMAEWIAWELEEANHNVLIQAWDIGPGKNFVKEMQNAATDAKCTIAVLSPDYLQSEFAMDEWRAAYAKAKNKEGSLVPVRIREITLTGIMATIVYMDLVGDDENSARVKLLAEFGKKHTAALKNRSSSNDDRKKPEFPPAFPNYPSIKLLSSIENPLYAIGDLDRTIEWDDHIQPLLDQFEVQQPPVNEANQNDAKEKISNKTCAIILAGVNEEWPETLEYRLRLKKNIPEQRVIRIRPGKLSEDSEKNHKMLTKEMWDRLVGSKLSPAANFISNNQNMTEKEKLTEFLKTQDSYIFVWRLAPKSEHFNVEKLTQLISHWHQLSLNENSSVHYLLLLYDQVRAGFFNQGEKKVTDWLKQVSEKLPSISHPPMKSPEWEDIDFWLNEYLRNSGIEQHAALRVKLERKRLLKKLFNKNIGFPMKTVYEYFNLTLNPPAKSSKK